MESKIIDLTEEDEERKIQPQAEIQASFKSIDEMVYTRVSQYLEQDHWGRHQTPANIVNSILDINTEATELAKVLNIQIFDQKKLYKDLDKLIGEWIDYICKNVTKCGRFDAKTLKKDIVDMHFREVWKWIVTNERKVFKERLEAVGNETLSKALEKKMPSPLNKYLSAYNKLKHLKPKEYTLLRKKVLEYIKVYTIL